MRTVRVRQKVFFLMQQHRWIEKIFDLVEDRDRTVPRPSSRVLGAVLDSGAGFLLEGSPGQAKCEWYNCALYWYRRTPTHPPTRTYPDTTLLAYHIAGIRWSGDV